MEKKSWVKIKCHKCGNEKIIFAKIAMEVKCDCGEVLATPTGGKAAIKAEILELL